MGTIKIENEHSLKEALRSGVNLFVGAGFSVDAENKKGDKLPLGKNLALELCEKFGKKASDNLSKISTLLEKTNRTEFYKFLVEKFTVAEFPKYYYAINKLNLKGVYTTNIDNLISKIVSANPKRYLHNQAQNGVPTDSKAIPYLPLHGSVEDAEPNFVFDVVSLANIYNDASRIWSFLSHAVEKYPTVFVGYGLNDSSTIQALTSQKTFNNAQKEKWILLIKDDEDDIEYYKSLGFSIIIANTKEFLEYIENVSLDQGVINSKKKNDELVSLLKGNLIPTSIKGQVVRPIDEFFKGQAPTWGDIINNNIYKTSHYHTIHNSIFVPDKHIIITGAPVTGKTTLMMQIAYNVKYSGVKLIFNNLTLSSAEYYSKLIGDNAVLIFIENFTDDINAFLKLAELKRVKLVGVDRSHNLNMVNHKFPANKYEIINVTQLTESDTQNIFDSLPPSIRGRSIKREQRNQYEDDSIFEFVIRNIKGQNVASRYDGVLKKLEREHHELAEFLVLCGYMHSSRVPLSLEVACSYFSDPNQLYNYRKVFEMRHDLDDLLKDYYSNELLDQDMDFYYPRSYFIAESIIKSASRDVLKEVMNKVIDRVPTVQIHNYHTFKKHAFDKSIVSKAFPDWKEGKEFYERVFLYDFKNPYVLQQGALYLSMKKKYHDAFSWIDRAITMTNNKHFSIRNSHAIILFDANYNVDSTDAERQLDASMDILSQCINSDLRTTFHAKTYADQAIRYYNKYGNNRAVSYLGQAKLWLEKEIQERGWDYDVKKQHGKINDILKHI